LVRQALGTRFASSAVVVIVYGVTEALGMELTGRGTRTFSAGLLGLLLATAVLLAIVLLDGQPALAQGDSGSETSYAEPLDSGSGLEGDNLDTSLADPPPVPEAVPLQAAENNASELLHDLDQPLDPTILDQRIAEARPAPDRTSNGGSPGQGTQITPNWAQIPPVGEPQTRDGLPLTQDDPPNGDSQPTSDGRTVLASTETVAPGHDAERYVQVAQVIPGELSQAQTPEELQAVEALADPAAWGGLVDRELAGVPPAEGSAPPQRTVRVPQDRPIPEALPSPQGADVQQAQGPSEPATPIGGEVEDDDEVASRAHQHAAAARRYASHFFETAAWTSDPVDVARANVALALAEAARAFAGVVDNAFAAEENGIPGAGSIAREAERGAWHAASASFDLTDKPGRVSALQLANFSDFAADNGARAAQYASWIVVAHNDQTALGRSLTVWAAQGAANAAQAAANAAAHAVFVQPDDSLVKQTAMYAQRTTDKATHNAAKASLALKQDTAGAEN